MHFVWLFEFKLYELKWFKNRLTRTLNIFGRIKLHSANFLEFFCYIYILVQLKFTCLSFTYADWNLLLYNNLLTVFEK